MLGNTVPRGAKEMFPRYRGLAGEYIWEKEKERLAQYKDRPWELESKQFQGNPLLSFLFIGLGILAGLILFSLFQ